MTLTYALIVALQADAVPVDTHVLTIACREFDHSLRECASLTPAVYLGLTRRARLYVYIYREIDV